MASGSRQPPAPLVMSMTLLVDINSQRVVYAEASKDVVDYLLNFLTLPLGRVVKLLRDSNISMVGCVGSMYRSVENLGNRYVSHDAASALLRPWAAGNRSGAYVSGSMVNYYMVSDNLEVTPPSNINAITTLINPRINIGCLRKMTVLLGQNERRQILKASLQSRTVLTDVFLRRTSPRALTAS